MTGGAARPLGWQARVPPLVLALVGLVSFAAFAGSALVDGDSTTWWAYVLPLVPAALLMLGGLVVAIDPRPLVTRRMLAAAALLWLLLLVAAVALEIADGVPASSWILLVIVAAIDALGLLGIAATTPVVTDERLPDPLGRLGAVVVFVVAIMVASGAIIVAVSVVIGTWNAIVAGTISQRLPWGAVVLVLVLPFASFGIATALTHQAAGGTFHAQAAANRRNSLLLLVTLVGVVAATAEIIAVSITLSAMPTLVMAGIAALVGLGAAYGADRFGADVVLRSAGAQPADPRTDTVLLDVVREISLAAGIEPPRAYVIEDGSMNAFATGRDARHGSVAVTRGLLEHLDREQLQGVIGHEVGHIRNLDVRYALYVAVLVGLVAVVTDGFLRLVVESWRHGAFIWAGGDSDDARAAIGAFVAGIFIGLFLLLVAVVLRVAAPLFAMLVQAAVSREREFLADATSVELTRNPHGLAGALTVMAGDHDDLDAANRGTQHLWFRNPVKAGSDRRVSLLSTHPSIGARIERLTRLQGVDVTRQGPSPLYDES
jgi:heat shock protein HtpX